MAAFYPTDPVFLFGMVALRWLGFICILPCVFWAMAWKRSVGNKDVLRLAIPRTLGTGALVLGSVGSLLLGDWALWLTSPIGAALIGWVLIAERNARHRPSPAADTLSEQSSDPSVWPPPPKGEGY